MVNLDELYFRYINCRLCIASIAAESRVDLGVLLDVCKMPSEVGKKELLRLTGQQMRRLLTFCEKNQYPKMPPGAKSPGRPKVGAKPGNRNASGPQKAARHVVVNNARKRKEILLK